MTELNEKTTEIYVRDAQEIRRRVYRGRNQQHIEWKKKTHAGRDLEIVELPTPPETFTQRFDMDE